MAKITAYTANTTPQPSDVMVMVDDPGGSPLTQKITIANLLKVINELTEDASPDTAADYMLTYDASASAVKKILLSAVGGGGSGGLTVSSAAVTTSNVTGVEDTHHILDVSGMTANRDFNLPTPSAAGKRCKVTLSVGDATYALIMKVNGSEVTRLYITNETLEFVSTGTGAGNWQLAQDGRIATIGVMERRAAQSINNISDTKIQLDTIVKNVGDVCDNATNYRVTIRRAGPYMITGFIGMAAAFEDQEAVNIYLYINGVLDRFAAAQISSASTNRPGMAFVTVTKDMAVGDYIEINAFHNEGGAVNTATDNYPQLSVVELGAGGGGTSGGGGGDALTTNPLSQFAATTSAQLAGVISDETGSGALVFGTSPTLTTPALGTPSALVLTNATGLPTAGLVDDAVTLAKFVNATAQYKLLGRLSASAGNFEEISGSANVFSLLQAADYAAMRTLLGLVIGTNVQAYDADLTTWAGKTAPSGTVIGTTDTQTLTNKRLTPRVGTVSSSATPTINTDDYDVFTITALAADITSMTTNLSGTPTDGQKLLIAITGTAARAITWGASFEASTIALPTTTVSTNRLDVGFIWNAATSKWRCIGYV